MSAPDLTLWQAAADLALEVHSIADHDGRGIHRPLAAALGAGLPADVVVGLARKAWTAAGRETALTLDCGHELEALRITGLNDTHCVRCLVDLRGSIDRAVKALVRGGQHRADVLLPAGADLDGGAP
jgi:hypothetical protein